jgi:propanediol utilization protein
LKKGVIRAARHVHMGPDDAKFYGVKDRQLIKLRVSAVGCTTTFEEVIVRVGGLSASPADEPRAPATS